MTSKTVLQWNCRLKKGKWLGQTYIMLAQMVPCHNIKVIGSQNHISPMQSHLTFSHMAWICLCLLNVIQQIVTEHPLGARHCSQLWGYDCGQSKQSSGSSPSPHPPSPRPLTYSHSSRLHPRRGCCGPHLATYMFPCPHGHLLKFWAGINIFNGRFHINPRHPSLSWKSGRFSKTDPEWCR